MTPQKLSDYLAKPAILAGCVALVWLGSLVLSIWLQPATDLAWRYFIADSILDGKIFYRDIVDLNPPLWFWAAMPSVWLGNIFGIGAHAPAMILAHLSIFVALWMFARGVDGILSKTEKSIALLGFVIATLWVAAADVGQREQSALVASLLWLVLALRRDARLPVSTGLALSIACFSAYGFALKHYFVLIPLVIECVLALRLGKNWRPLRPETLALAALAIAYGISVFLFAPDFLTEIVPIAALSYESFNAWSGLSPWHAFGMIIGPAQFMIVPWALALRLKEKTPIVLGLLGLSLLFLLIILFQMKGFFYHYIALKGVCLLILMIWLGRDSTMGTLDVWLVRVGILGYFMSMIVNPLSDVFKSGVTPVSETLQPMIRSEPASNRMMILSTVPQSSFYVLVSEGRSFGSRHYSMWMVPGLMVRAQDPKTAEAAKAQLARVRRDYLEDIQCFAPAILISQSERFKGQNPIETEGMAFLRQDPEIDRWMTDHYRLESRVKEFQVWRQLRPLDPKGANCPSSRR
jgi:hypothetical protein